MHRNKIEGNYVFKRRAYKFHKIPLERKTSKSIVLQNSTMVWCKTCKKHTKNIIKVINANDIKTNHRTRNISRSTGKCLLFSRKNIDVQNKDSARRTAIYFSSLVRFWFWTVQLARDAVKFRFHSVGWLRHILMGLKGLLAVFPSDKFSFSSFFICSMLEKKSVKHFSFTSKKLTTL